MLEELDQLLAELELALDLLQWEVVALVERAEMDPMVELSEQLAVGQLALSPLQSLELFENQLGFEE